MYKIEGLMNKLRLETFNLFRIKLWLIHEIRLNDETV